MANNAKNVSHGTVGATVINVDLARVDHGAAAVKVQLSGNYVRSRPPGAPSAPGFTGAAATLLDFPRTHPSGAILTLHKAEAAALVSAGVAAYV